jgi:tRNA(fMet)-specific endonuclease VapC
VSANRLDFIADTSAVARLIREDPSVLPFFTAKKFAITYVTLAELSVGAMIAPRSPDAWLRMLRTLAKVQTLTASRMTSLHYALIHDHLKRQGQMIPINDIWIAAVCLEHNLPLLARDEHFSRIPNLKVIPC